MAGDCICRRPVRSILYPVFLLCLAGVSAGASGTEEVLHLSDVFQLEYASDPRISPDGGRIAYVRNSMDIMLDRALENVWIVDFDGTDHRALTSGMERCSSPRWSPDGTRLLYLKEFEETFQLQLRWMDTGQTARLASLTRKPGGLRWSPDGQWVAFSMLVPEQRPPFAEMPSKPDGASWAEPAKVIDKVLYRSDGTGYLEDGFVQLFVVPAESGTPRQLTFERFHHSAGGLDAGSDGSLSWSADSRFLIFAANRHEDWEHDPLNSDIYEISVSDGKIRALTDRYGPDTSPAVSPEGLQIAYVGFDDRKQGYQVRNLYLMNRDGSGSRNLTRDLDRSVQQPVWASDNRSLYFLYSDRGNTKIGKVSTEGQVGTLAGDVGGVTLGRPYGSGSFSVAQDGRFAYTLSRPDHPADVAAGDPHGDGSKRLTRLNEDLLGYKKLAPVEEIWWGSSYDGRKIQGWVARPPSFDPLRKYPLILEIHGGPFMDYGDRFSAEIQLYAAAGYVVLYCNPRGSSSYGEEFGNLIHHNYPGQDFDDLMSGVDAVLRLGSVDEDNLFVTGGSGGGVLTSWIVGKTDRFRAAVVAKPVINWYSFVLTSDEYTFFHQYWFPGFPWDHPEHYLRRSPISLVGNVKTPTMLLTGEADYRTPISESEQYYQALKLRGIETVLVRIPEASHEIAARPSNLVAKVAHVLKWFEKHQKPAP